jgi:hypothetical protein
VEVVSPGEVTTKSLISHDTEDKHRSEKLLLVSKVHFISSEFQRFLETVKLWSSVFALFQFHVLSVLLSENIEFFLAKS